MNSSGRVNYRFGRNPDADPRTIWIVKRSTDLQQFEEIYRFDGSANSPAPGIGFIHGGSSITIIDTFPPAGKVFYRFEAEQSDP